GPSERSEISSPGPSVPTPKLAKGSNMMQSRYGNPGPSNMRKLQAIFSDGLITSAPSYSSNASSWAPVTDSSQTRSSMPSGSAGWPAQPVADCAAAAASLAASSAWVSVETWSHGMTTLPTPHAVAENLPACQLRCSPALVGLNASTT